MKSWHFVFIFEKCTFNLSFAKTQFHAWLIITNFWEKEKARQLNKNFQTHLNLQSNKPWVTQTNTLSLNMNNGFNWQLGLGSPSWHSEVLLASTIYSHPDPLSLLERVWRPQWRVVAGTGQLSLCLIIIYHCAAVYFQKTLQLALIKVLFKFLIIWNFESFPMWSGSHFNKLDPFKVHYFTFQNWSHLEKEGG